MNDKKMQDAGIQIGVAFIVGVMVGAVAMLFLAPRSGKELRIGIHDGALNLRDQAQLERERLHVRMDEMNAKIDEMKRQAKSIGHHEDVPMDSAEEISSDETNLD